MRRRPSTSQPMASASPNASFQPLPVEESQQQVAHRTYPIILNDNVKNEQRPLPPAQPPPAVPVSQLSNPVQVPPGPSDSILAGGDKGASDKPMIIQPPLPPQHVYAPMPALGALSIGFLSKKKEKKEDADFRLITNGSFFLRACSFFIRLNCSTKFCSKWKNLRYY